MDNKTLRWMNYCLRTNTYVKHDNGDFSSEPELSDGYYSLKFKRRKSHYVVQVNAGKIYPYDLKNGKQWLPTGVDPKEYAVWKSFNLATKSETAHFKECKSAGFFVPKIPVNFETPEERLAKLELNEINKNTRNLPVKSKWKLI